MIKVGLQTYGEDGLDGDVAAGIEDALAACNVVDFSVFEAAEVTLIGAIEQVVSYDVEFAELVASVQEDVCAEREVEQRVDRRGGLGVVGAEVVVLPEIVFYVDADEGIVEDVVEAVVFGFFVQVVGCGVVVVAVVDEFPFHFARESCRRSEWQVARVGALVELAGIDV